MSERNIEGTRWVSDEGAFILVKKVEDQSVYFEFVTEPGIHYHTSLKVFELFYRQLEPEEVGLMLLGDL